MDILHLHNSYQKKGGEDSVVDLERQLLLEHGHKVGVFSRDNQQVRTSIQKILVACQCSFSRRSRNSVSTLLKTENYDIAHIHNFFPLLTPAVYDACREAGVPVVQSLHNYRPICPGALLMRDEKPCELCLSGNLWNAVYHRCYRHSLLGSVAVARMVAYHKKRKTWQEQVDLFISPSRFLKDKFVEAGFSAEKIVVKPNFCREPTVSPQRWSDRQGALYAGRLCAEKGFLFLIRVWKTLTVSLRVAGEGPLSKELYEKKGSAVQLLGYLGSEKLSQEMGAARFLVMPSLTYETFGMVIVEAFAHGLPVIASRQGAMAEIVEDGVTGLHFNPGDADDLAAKVRWMDSHPDECCTMGENARQVYEQKYTSERNYPLLLQLYKKVIANKTAKQNW